MVGSTFGKVYRVTTWGESHGKALGAVVDGCPAGVPLTEEDIQSYLDRRKPGQSKATTARKEADRCEILSGVFDGKTTGTPISVLVWNGDQHSKDYSNIAHVYRPGHADYTFQEKYGIRDYRGGGRSSGRETIGRVIGGAIAMQVLKEFGISFTCYAKSIGPVVAENVDPVYISKNPFCLPDPNVVERAQSYLDACMERKDSIGGVIECRVDGLPVGLGEPVFDKLDALLGQAVMSIGAIKGFEVGDGFQSSLLHGSQDNDGFYMDGDEVKKSSNHSGGTLGGMSDGGQLVFRAAVKPTPSIAQAQQTVDDQGNDTLIVIHGRHDPIIVPRAVVVVESMAAITILDLMMQNASSQVDALKNFYKK